MLLIHILDKVYIKLLYLYYVLLVVYNNNLYFDIVAETAEQSMVDAIEKYPSYHIMLKMERL